MVDESIAVHHLRVIDLGIRGVTTSVQNTDNGFGQLVRHVKKDEPLSIVVGPHVPSSPVPPRSLSISS
jgi:hypothetical protein